MRCKSHTCDLLELADHAVELVHERAPADLAEGVHERAVIPEVIRVGIEPSPQFLPHQAVVEEHRARVVNLVRERDAHDLRRCRREMLDVLLLARTPGRLRHDVGVAAARDDLRHVVAEAGADVDQTLGPALVFDRVVEKRRDRLLLAASVFQHERGNAEQMGHVGDVAALPALGGVSLRGVRQGFFEPRSEHGVIIAGMPDEQEELTQAWEALGERERLVNETLSRRAAELDARARRFAEIAADLDARSQLLEEAEAEVAERERRLTLAQEELRDRQEDVLRSQDKIEHVRAQRRELDLQASELRALASELEERGDWIATASAALEAQERRAAAVAEQAAELELRATEIEDQERLQGAAMRQLETKAAELEARATDLAAKEQKIDQARSEVEPLLEAVKKREREVQHREQMLAGQETRAAEREKQLGKRAAKLALNETQLANKLRDVRESEERIPLLEQRALHLDARARELERDAKELDERGAWLTEAVAQVEAREAEAIEQIERAAAEVRR